MPGHDPLESLPTLDLRRFETDRENFLADVRAAAREAGFFYLVGHGIEPKLIDEVLTLSRRFFALPERDKRAIEMIHSPHFRGYNRAGLEHTRGKPDWREQIDIGAEREALPFDPAAPAWRRLQGPNQWPDALPELSTAHASSTASCSAGRAFPLGRGPANRVARPSECRNSALPTPAVRRCPGSRESRAVAKHHAVPERFGQRRDLAHIYRPAGNSKRPQGEIKATFRVAEGVQ